MHRILNNSNIKIIIILYFIKLSSGQGSWTEIIMLSKLYNFPWCVDFMKLINNKNTCGFTKAIYLKTLCKLTSL